MDDFYDGARCLRVSWPKPGLSLNGRAHWAVRAALQKKQKREWFALARALVPASRTTPERIAVSLLFCPPDRRRRDLDNLLAGVKAGLDGLSAGLDGLSAALGVDDSRFDLRIAMGPVVKGGHVKVGVGI